MHIKGLWHGVTSPRRAARSRGFGIHSPFAFRFVREVLTQRYAYYSYPELDKAARADGVPPAVVRALFRTALAFRPAPITVVGDKASAPSVRHALALGNPAAPPDTDATYRCTAGLGSHAAQVEAAWAAAQCGMLFRAPGLTVLVDSTRLPHQSFDILLP